MKILNKEIVIENLLKRMGIKAKPPIIDPIAEAPKKPSGVRLYGKRLAPKPQAKPKTAAVVTPKPKPKRPLMKYVAISVADKARIESLSHTDPLRALALSTRVHKELRLKNAKIKAYNELSPLELERAEERNEIVKKAAESLTDNLDKPNLDINWRKDLLLQHIADAAFRSSLKSDFLWIGGGNFGGTLKVKSGAITVEIDRDNIELLNSAAAKLFAWSGVSKVLESPTASHLQRYLSVSADNYAVSQKKLKPSEYYLNQLVEKSIKAPLQYTKDTSTRSEILAALALATAEAGVALGFYRDSGKNVNIDCSDNKFGTTQLSKKALTPYFESIIERSTVAGRLKAASDPANLLIGFINLLPR